MKTLAQSGRIGLIAGLILVGGLSVQGEDAAGRPVQVSGNVEAVIPSRLIPLLLDNPTVTFRVTVSDEGKLVDHLALAAPHHELLARAEATLQKLSFSPALVDGKPVQSTGEVTISFFDPDQRAYRRGLTPLPFGSSATDGAIRRVYEGSKDHFAYRRAQPTELDQPIAERETKVMVLADSSGKPAEGTCVVDYYIDAQGDVRLPRVVSSDNDTVALSALLTLQHTRYEPVTRQGVPAYVKVRLPMSFVPKGESANATK